MINLSSIIVPGQTIGIIGGGQLGRMMAIAAREKGYCIAVLDPTPNSPCGQIADYEFTASFNDLEAIKELASVSDVITYEFENIDYEALTWLEQYAYLPQGSALLKVTQDRGDEKKALQGMNIPTAPYKLVNSEEQLVSAIQEIGVPCVLKTCRGGYDGKGQFVIRSLEDYHSASALLQYGSCVLESWIPFQLELSVIVVRSVSGEICTFPVAENIHINNILHKSIVPARVPIEVIQKAENVARKIAGNFSLVGTLAVEMFVTSDGNVLVNELAPRPHNSGHYTIDACETSQFDQHIRAICNLPLGRTTLLRPAVMVNILGQHIPPLLENVSLLSNSKLHLYGKKEAKQNRKMGHITRLANTTDDAEKQLDGLPIWEARTEWRI
ncbi:5-(carboxyamino)imidazole ribonucleotide synthase [Bacillus sp. HMF5848]|uniref:5-(carboxyamino)imidazole ribonucleotide synthase n=1 Tax=Bacillus sp. HMF5848 TaxID=2495421 RepID=UPI000F799BBE|nr:5-(carboxyamino)imidazole ribonucleotide synthase [Bacillus sp. HMF5848]RSK25747.1 5-(carboxyamino)imidazole ribonucleotide synthase [Bacillus sp. HMF5848]